MSLHKIKAWFDRKGWKAQIRRKFLRDFLNTDIGKTVLSELVLYVMLGVDPFHLGGGDANKAIYHSGRQSVVHHLLDISELSERDLV
jgi:hypothetical protein